MSKVHVFTSCALNYLPKARVLFNSLRKHHPEFVLHLALADDPRGLVRLENEPFDDLMTISDLGIPDWKAWAFCHPIVELCTAIKPFALLRLLAREDCGKVLYFDPDIAVFSRLDDIVQALDEIDIALTPHQLTPETSIRSVIDNEITSLRNGIYNLGFIGVACGDESRRFAAWWATRLYHFCRDEPAHGLFTDQRWIDLVPAFFDGVGILRTTRHNAATWNVTMRQVSGDVNKGILIDGQPLGFYHFTGFDKGDHEYMAAKVAGDNPALRGLIDWYVQHTQLLAQDRLSQVQWAFRSFSNDQPIAPEQRLVYRERPDLQARFQDPFDASPGDTYLRWWHTKAPKAFPGLFEDGVRDHAMERIRSNLTEGYRGTAGKVDWAMIARHATVALKSPRYAAALANRAMRRFSQHGLSGVLSKVRRI